MASKKKNTTKTGLSIKDQMREKKLEIKELKEEINNLNEKNVKLLAEFDNFQRRTFEEKEKIKKYQSLDIIKDLLPAIDDINRSIEFYNIENNNSVVEAISMISSKIESVLTKHSIQRFESLDTNFDPNLHEALLEVNSNTFKKGKIMKEYEKGYMYHDKIVRHAKVVVSKGKLKK